KQLKKRLPFKAEPASRFTRPSERLAALPAPAPARQLSNGSLIQRASTSKLPGMRSGRKPLRRGPGVGQGASQTEAISDVRPLRARAAMLSSPGEAEDNTPAVPDDPFVLLLKGIHQPVVKAPNLGLSLVNLNDGSYIQTKIYPVSGTPGSN